MVPGFYNEIKQEQSYSSFAELIQKIEQLDLKRLSSKQKNMIRDENFLLHAIGSLDMFFV